MNVKIPSSTSSILFLKSMVYVYVRETGRGGRQIGRRLGRGISSSFTNTDTDILGRLHSQPNPNNIFIHLVCCSFLTTSIKLWEWKILPLQNPVWTNPTPIFDANQAKKSPLAPQSIITLVPLKAFIILISLSPRLSRKQALPAERHSTWEASLSPCWVLTFICPPLDYSAFFWVSNRPTFFQQEGLCLLCYAYMCQEIQPEIHKDITVEK